MGSGLVVQADLDILLYAWLSEPDERRADEQFTRYFQVAFPEICRFIRSFRADSATAQDLSQQALIKLFNYLGKDRSAADARLREALALLTPLPFGALHVRIVQAWRSQVGGFRDAALRFRIPNEPQRNPLACKELREEINGRIEPLQRQGTHFLGEVRARVGLSFNALVEAESTEGSASGVSTLAVQRPSEKAAGKRTPDTPEDQIPLFVTTLLRYVVSRDSAQVDSALGCVGAVDFVSCTSTICDTLPALTIPSNSLLYTIAKRQFLDGLRSKRTSDIELLTTAEDTDPDVLDELDLDGGFAMDRPYAPVESATAVMSDGENRDERDSRVEARYRAFVEFLRAPLTRAEGSLAEASLNGKAKAEQARVEALQRKYDRLMTVLHALHESPQPSEEDIARRHGLSRNQVKYAIERIREEFSHFFPDLARETQGRRKRQGAEL
jgi:DNA-directed RNA polymerase specialized sigma24 family protein